MPAMNLAGRDGLLLWTQIAALLVAARLLGMLVGRLRQPAVVGSLLAGLLLGPSVLGQVWPAAEAWFLPPHGHEPQLLTAVSTTCLLVLLVGLGAETDLPLLRSLGRTAGWVSAGSIGLPLAVGLAAGYLLPASLVGAHAPRSAFAVLLAGGLGASSLPVVARIVRELGLGRRDFGQLAVAAATVNDIFGFVLLAVAAALASRGGGSSSSGLVVPLVGLVAVFALTASAQPLIDRLLLVARRRGPNVAGSLAVGFATVFTLSAITAALHIDAALGAFLAGVALGRSRFQQSQALRVVEDTTSALFAPLYFATAGLQVDLTALAHPTPALAFAALLALAAASKFAGTFLVGPLARASRREGAALGFLLNGRGAMQVIIGSAGLTLGIFPRSVYTLVIVIALLTSLAVTPAVRLTLAGMSARGEERQRLDREEELSANVVVRGQRLLLPSRGGLNSIAAAAVLDSAWPDSSELTVLSIAERPVQLQLSSGRPLRARHVPDGDVLESVLEEANLGYGVIAVGTVDTPTGDRLLPEVIEGLLGFSPLPVLVVRRGEDADLLRRTLQARFRRILTPVTGGTASRAAQEVAHNISRRSGAPVALLHVVLGAGVEAAAAVPQPARFAPREHGTATAVLTEARSVADEHRIDAHTLLRRGVAAEEILRAARELDADLVVLGATVRRVGGRPFLGHTVEQVLSQARSATVAIVVLPDVTVTETAEGHADRSAR